MKNFKQKNFKQKIYENILGDIEYRNDIASSKYFKTVLEFNPSDNNYFSGYMRACTDLREDVISRILKEC